MDWSDALIGGAANLQFDPISPVSAKIVLLPTLIQLCLVKDDPTVLGISTYYHPRVITFIYLMRNTAGSTHDNINYQAPGSNCSRYNIDEVSFSILMTPWFSKTHKLYFKLLTGKRTFSQKLLKTNLSLVEWWSYYGTLVYVYIHRFNSYGFQMRHFQFSIL